MSDQTPSSYESESPQDSTSTGLKDTGGSSSAAANTGGTSGASANAGGNSTAVAQRIRKPTWDDDSAVQEKKKRVWFSMPTPRPGYKPNIWLRMFGGLTLFVFFVLPYLVMLIGSVKSQGEIRGIPPTYLPTEWIWDNYVTMWDTPETPVFDNLISTIVISASATIIVLLVATPAAYYTARYKFPGRMAFMFVVLLTQMLQPAVLAAGLFRQFTSMGLGDTWLAMILINSAFNLSFATWIMHSFFASVPKEIDEAARIDGCGSWSVLFKINLPLVWPGIVTAIIFTFVAAWNEFAASLVILSTPEKQPLSVALTKFVGQYSTSWQYVFGVSVIAIIPVVVLFAFVEKRLVGGLTAGAVK